MDQPKEQASFISDFKKNQEKQFEELVASRKIRLRSSIFDLPEFESAPLMSCIIPVNSKREFDTVKLSLEENNSNPDLEIHLLLKEGLVIPELSNYQIDVQSFDLSRANYSTWLNETAVKANGKIIYFLNSNEQFRSADLIQIANEIKDSQNSLLYIQALQHSVIGVAMARDLFFLACGFDELIEDLNVSFPDMIFRMEMLGGHIEGSNWPLPNVADRAEKNIRTGRLIVNHGLGTFISEY